MLSTTRTSYEVSADVFGAIELASIEYPVASHDSKSLQRRPEAEHREEENSSSESLTVTGTISISKWRVAIIVGTIALDSLAVSMLGGILVVSLPTMARDIRLSDALLLWPASVNSLACGTTLLISGSIADVVGGRKVYLIGSLMLTGTTIACGVCTSGIQLILFRAAQGVANSLCLPSSVILITRNIPVGSYRNTAFACLGAGQPLGFSIGLVLGGVFVQGPGWRWGYYIGAILTFAIFLASVVGIPADPHSQSQSFATTLKRIKTEIDWIGCSLLSTSLGMFSYVFSVIAGKGSDFVSPLPITLFSTAIALIAMFLYYSKRQERHGRKVIIPPSLWGNRVFTSLCITIFFVWGVFNSIQYFLTLFYQLVQNLSAIQTSIRFLPMVVTGATTNLITGYLVKRVRADVLIFSSAATAAIAPLLLAIVKPEWSYWSCAFIATACTPICADVLFTVANLLITSLYPQETHGLAGGVFNTVSNIGNSMMLAVTAVLASSITMQQKIDTNIEALMDGYRATFWFCFAANVAVLGVIAFGLRKIGKVGIKVD